MPMKDAGEPRRLGRKTRRIGRRMLVACGLAGVAGAAFLAYHHGDRLIARADQLVADIGLRADQVAVISKRSGVLDDVALADAFAAIAADGDGSIFSFDTAAARQRLQELPWVAAAEVRRVLPDGLEVVVEARSPIAVWQTRGMLFLVDAKGHALSPVVAGRPPGSAYGSSARAPTPPPATSSRCWPSTRRSPRG